MRIVSLVPSLSRTVCDLGLKDKIVGCTTFCISPADLYKTAAQVGGTKDADLTKVRELNPTHILVNDEENTPEIITGCKAIAETVLTAPVLPEDSAKVILQLGDVLDCGDKARELAQSLTDLLAEIRAVDGAEASFLYLIWRDPYMAAGQNTYLNHVVELLGWKNVLTGEQRYPSLSVDEVKRLAPEKVLFTSEPYPFRNRHIEQFQEEVGYEFQAYKADGLLFTWWGSPAVELFEEILKIKKGHKSDLLKTYSESGN